MNNNIITKKTNRTTNKIESDIRLTYITLLKKKTVVNIDVRLTAARCRAAM